MVSSQLREFTSVFSTSTGVCVRRLSAGVVCHDHESVTMVPGEFSQPWKGDQWMSLHFPQYREQLPIIVVP